MLREIGWRAEAIDGGYRSYRRLVNGLLYDQTLPHRIVLLDGSTGTAKTDLLAALKRIDVQTLDLEGLANHRGSLLGERPGGQPDQKAFESGIAAVLAQADPDRPLVIEAESSKIGVRNLPPALWRAMCAAPRIRIEAPFEARVSYLTRAYDDILSNPEKMREKLLPLIKIRGRPVLDGWLSALDAGDKAGLTAALMAQHYDLSYAKAQRPAQALITLNDLGAAALDAAAAKIKTILDQMKDSPGEPAVK